MNGPRHQAAVSLTRVAAGPGGASCFEDVELAYTGPGNPLVMTEIRAATAISFRWTPADYAFDFHPAPRHRLIVLLEGALEVVTSDHVTRRFSVGDLLEVADVGGTGHISRAAGGKPFRSAVINLDDRLVHSRMRPITAPTGIGVPYRRTIDGPDGRSRTLGGVFSYAEEGPSGLVTGELPLTGFQFVLAPGDLSYDWHQAPQRQIVLPLTGGMEIENGAGERFFVRPGEIYIGEDTAGNGHITRSIDGQPRFSIFAHLAEGALSRGDL